MYVSKLIVPTFFMSPTEIRLVPFAYTEYSTSLAVVFNKVKTPVQITASLSTERSWDNISALLHI